jgi:hypothetical protein
MKRASPGQFLVGVIAFMAMLMIVIQAMVYFTDRETKWTYKERNSTTAFYLAETGANRAVWKLREVGYDSALTSIPSGFDFSSDFTDVPGGTYRVRIATAAYTIIILSSGKDTDSGEIRTVEVRIGTTTESSWAMTVAAATFGSNLRTFWAPIYATGDLNLGAASAFSNQYFPRMYSRGAILATGTGIYGNRDSSSAEPNTDGVQWWSYQGTDVVPDPPSVDLNHYLNLATAQGRYYSTGSISINNPNLPPGTDAVFYFDSGVTLAKFRDSGGGGSGFIQGTIISRAASLSFDLTPNATGQYKATPPSSAWKEYQKNTPYQGYPAACLTTGGGYNATAASPMKEDNASCTDQYPGDGGYHVSEEFNFATMRCTAHNQAGGALAGTGIQIKGFVYVKAGTVTGSVATAIHGRMMWDSGVTMGTNNLQVFYDPSVTVVTTSGSSATESWKQKTWKEVKQVAF